MARREERQHKVYAISVQEFPVCYHTDDIHSNHAVQRLPETGYHLLYYSAGICRCFCCNAPYREDIQLCGYRRYIGIDRHDY